MKLFPMVTCARVDRLPCTRFLALLPSFVKN